MDKVSDAVVERAKQNFQGAVDVAKRAKQRSVELSAEESRAMRERRERTPEPVAVLRSRPSPYRPDPDARGTGNPKPDEDVRARLMRLEAERSAASAKGLPVEALKREILQCQETLRVAKLQKKIGTLKNLQRRTPTDARAMKLEALMATLRELQKSRSEALAVQFQRAAKEHLDRETYQRVLAAAQRALG